MATNTDISKLYKPFWHILSLYRNIDITKISLIIEEVLRTDLFVNI